MFLFRAFSGLESHTSLSNGVFRAVIKHFQMPLKINCINSLIDSSSSEGQRGVCSEGESCGGDQGERETGKGKSIYSINLFLSFLFL